MCKKPYQILHNFLHISEEGAPPPDFVQNLHKSGGGEDRAQQLYKYAQQYKVSAKEEQKKCRERKRKVMGIYWKSTEKIFAMYQ